MAVKMRAAKVVKPVEAEPWGCIYHAVNLLNQKGYVGQHKNVLTVEGRWNTHVKAAHTKKWQDPDYKARQAAAHTLGVYAQAAESNRLTAQRKRQEKEKNAQAA